MEQKDYLMRQIEQAGLFLRLLVRRMLGLVHEPESVEEQKITTSELLEKLNLSEKDLKNHDSTLLVRKIEELAGFNLENIEILADYMVLLANTASHSSDETERLKNNACSLYRYIDIQSKTYSVERYAKIEKLNTYR